MNYYELRRAKQTNNKPDTCLLLTALATGLAGPLALVGPLAGPPTVGAPLPGVLA